MEPREIEAVTEALRKRESEIVVRVETWSKVNSGSDNPAGVAKMANLLQAELEQLTADVQQIALP